jgi:putative DNA primase/helicase
MHEIKNDGIACFMHYALSLDLSNFDAHTKPPLNVEKQGLIDASMPSPAYFHRRWKANELDMPYMCGTTTQIYKYFCRWCDKNGEFKRTQRYFSIELQRCMTPHRLNMNYPYANTPAKTTRVFLTDEMVLKHADPEFRKLVENSCREFDKMLTNEQ